MKDMLSNSYLYSLLFASFAIPALPLVAVLVRFIVAWVQKREIVMPIKPEQISDGHKLSRLFTKNDHDFLEYILVSTCISCVPLLVYLNKKYQSHIQRLVCKGGMEYFCTICIAFTTMIFAMAFVLMLREKKYYLVFSITDVLEKYDFFIQLKKLFVSCLIVCLSIITFLDGRINNSFDEVVFTIFELSFGMNVVYLCLCFHNISKIMLSSEQGELNLLDKLYQILGIVYLDTTNIKSEWNDIDAIKIHIEYLYEKYIQSYKNICKDDTEKVICISCFEGEDEQKDLIKNANWTYAGAAGCMFIIWVIMLGINDFEHIPNSGMWIQMVLFLLDFGLLLIPCNKLKILIFQMFGSHYEYKFYNSKGRSKVVSEFRDTICKRKYLRYIRAMNSFIAFIYIATIRKVKIKKLNDILKEYVATGKNGTRSAVELLPFWVIGYLIKGKNENEITYLKEAYEDMGLNKEQKAEFRKMVSSQIKYINRKRNSGHDLDGTKYLKWLCG